MVFLTDLKSAGFPCELTAVDVGGNQMEDTYLLLVELFCYVVLVQCFPKAGKCSASHFFLPFNRCLSVV